MNTSLFNFDLPKNLIAQKPARRRELSNLMVLDRKTKNITLCKFSRIADFLKKDDVLVLNNTKVVRARISARRESGGVVEILVLKGEKPGRRTVKCLLKPLKKIQEGETLLIGKEHSCRLIKKINGIAELSFNANVGKIMEKHGRIPLPPYIHEENQDFSRYQTVFSKYAGAVAAPTAGLHFTKELLEKIEKKGVEILFITLHVGYGTFTPIRTEEIETHLMESEYFSIPPETARIINKARREKRRIIACGTTVARTLEDAAVKKGNSFFLKSASGFTDKYIYPPYKFKIADALITNFHTPSSSLLVLTSAFAGRKFLLSSYREAVKRKWRFFSFGDCMFIH